MMRFKIKKEQKTIINSTFEDWYLDFREEVAKKYGANYSISVISWTFSENYLYLYERGLTPKKAVLEI